MKYLSEKIFITVFKQGHTLVIKKTQPRCQKNRNIIFKKCVYNAASLTSFSEHFKVKR